MVLPQCGHPNGSFSQTVNETHTAKVFLSKLVEKIFNKGSITLNFDEWVFTKFAKKGFSEEFITLKFEEWVFHPSLMKPPTGKAMSKPHCRFCYCNSPCRKSAFCASPLLMPEQFIREFSEPSAPLYPKTMH